MARPLNICILAAGAAGMYCGSCLRDNALAVALLKLGHKVTLVPLYTPLRTDTPGVATHEVFYGGINVYLQHASKLFRITPRVFDWLFDRPWLLRAAGSMGAGASPAKLASLTRDILLGYNGPTQKELRRLMAFLASDIKPDVIVLPNLMFIGMAQSFREKLHCPVICELTGEDVFLDAMLESDRDNLRGIIRAAAPHVMRFVATSQYYADKMAAYLSVPREQIAIVYPGLPDEILAAPPRPEARAQNAEPTISFLARLCPEKGTDQLVEAFFLLKNRADTGRVRLDYAGYLGPQYKAWHRILQARIASAGHGASIHWRGEVDMAGKLDLLDGSHLFCVPTRYPESKGIYVLEALARGLPVVAPAHGSFPELARLTGSIQLTPPNDPPALAETLHGLLVDPARLGALAQNARAVVHARFTSVYMAQEFATLCEDAMGARV
jgi:glycosyltransferase involved in cell wall biosynthesis